MAEWKGYQFKVPTLPKMVYGHLMFLREKLGVTYWQAVILGIEVAASLYLREEDKARESAEKVKAAFPDAPDKDQQPQHYQGGSTA